MSVCQQDRSQNIILSSLAKCAKDGTPPVAHVQAVYTPIPLGKIDLAAHFLAAVVHSVVCYRVPLTKKKIKFQFQTGNMRKAWKGFKTLAGHTKPKLNSSNKLGDNNNNREHIERFWNLKVLYSVQFN